MSLNFLCSLESRVNCNFSQRFDFLRLLYASESMVLDSLMLSRGSFLGSWEGWMPPSLPTAPPDPVRHTPWSASPRIQVSWFSAWMTSLLERWANPNRPCSQLVICLPSYAKLIQNCLHLLQQDIFVIVSRMLNHAWVTLSLFFFPLLSPQIWHNLIMPLIAVSMQAIDAEYEYEVSCSYCEVYNELIFDLLVPNSTPLSLRQAFAKFQVLK